MGRDSRNRLLDFRWRCRDFSRLAFRFSRLHEEGRLGAGLTSGAFALARGRLGFRCGRRNSARRPRGGRLQGRRFRLVGRGWHREGTARRREGVGREWVCLWLGGRGVLGERRGASNGEFTLFLGRREISGGGEEGKGFNTEVTEIRDIGRREILRGDLRLMVNSAFYRHASKAAALRGSG